jgi:hypothetical protein
MAWDYWEEELQEPGTDWAMIAGRLKALRAAGSDLYTPQNRGLLEALEAALVPSKAKPGSIEAMIDGLTEAHASSPSRDYKQHPQYLRLVDRGFAAVPQLIRHLDDNRLTRAVKAGCSTIPRYQCRVCDLVSDLLQGLAGEDLGKTWLDRMEGYPVEKADAVAWWRKAEPIGEEAYVRAHAVRSAAGTGTPSEEILRLVVTKYLRHLPHTYRTIVDDRPSVESAPVAAAVASSSLPRAEKVGLLRYAASGKSLRHRLPALERLKGLDAKLFVELLTQTLEGLPRTPAEPDWQCPEGSFARLVIETDDPRAWETLEKVARRSDVGLRMQLLSPLESARTGPRRKRALALLAAFLDDASARTRPGSNLFGGTYAGYQYPRLEVRDLAAMRIASLLELEVEPKPDGCGRTGIKGFRGKPGPAASSSP